MQTRRDILLFMGGGAAGAFLTPARGVWSLTPPSGPRTGPASHAPRAAKSPPGTPIALSAPPDAPCARGASTASPSRSPARSAPSASLATTSLPSHRLKQGTPDEAAAAAASAIAKCAPAEKVAVLDPLPGRTASSTYQRAMAALKNGVYLAPPIPAPVDLSKARTVLSLGVPLLNGWGTPANVHAARANFHLIQAEPFESPTAALADEWLQILPGSEAALVQALKGPSAAPPPASLKSKSPISPVSSR